MRLEDELLQFLRRPLMCILAGADAEGRPSAGRGIGVQLLEGRESVELIFSGWQWPRLESDIRLTGRLAATFVSPSDYVAFQLKGLAKLRPTVAADLETADRFMERATESLVSLGVPARIIAPWLTAREARVAQLSVREIYVQTPGPLAGMRAGASAGAGPQ